MDVTPPRHDVDMRNVAITRHSETAARSAVAAVAAVAASIAEAQETRDLRRDATAMVERMAVRGRAAGLDHPVAAAIALAARVSELAGPEAFAERHGIAPAELAAAEAGVVRLGALSPGYGSIVVALGLDLLSLADLEASWARLDVERCRHC